jgi:acyl-CoA reductase-like NAD-dependent aldehyde dehydrogenase
MSWSDLDEQHKTTFHREYVASHEPAERSWLIENILSNFPQYRKSVVENAIQEVCTSMAITPRKRKEFLAKLQQNLENKKTEKAEIRNSTGEKIKLA